MAAERRVTIILVPRKAGDSVEALQMVAVQMKDDGIDVRITGADAAQVDYRIDERLETEVRTHAAPIVDQANAEMDAKGETLHPDVEVKEFRQKLRRYVNAGIRIGAKVIEWAAKVWATAKGS